MSQKPTLVLASGSCLSFGDQIKYNDKYEVVADALEKSLNGHGANLTHVVKVISTIIYIYLVVVFKNLFLFLAIPRSLILPKLLLKMLLVCSIAGDNLCDGHEQIFRGEQDLCPAL